MNTNIRNLDFSGDDPLIKTLQSLNDVDISDDDFPITVFPQAVQRIIEETNRTLKYPKGFVSAAMLFAASTAIGNSHRIVVKNGWTESAVLYLVNVGAPGTNKTHPTKFALEPLLQLDLESYKRFKKQKQEFEELSTITKQEREQEGMPQPIRPVWQKNLVSDFTQEALVKTHESNPRGLGVYTDEVMTWINNFGRYTKGSENQFWLSNWSQAPINVDRKGDDGISIEKPFVSVIGSIQPSMLSELAGGNRGNNGFLDRILFVYPENVKKESWSSDELDPTVPKRWAEIVRRITSLAYHRDVNGNFKAIEIMLSSEAREILFEWQKKNTDLCNGSEERLASIYSKLEIYVCRLTLILQILKWGCTEGDKDAISAENAENAIALIEYFRRTALSVHSILTESPSEKLPEDKKAVFQALPDRFTTGEGLAAAKASNMNERTFYRLLDEKAFFKKIRHGLYEKIK
jgi:hypothetical protein